MFKKTITTAVLIMSFNTVASANLPEQFLQVKSTHSVKTTIDKLQSIVSKKGLTIFTRVKHSNSAKKVKIKINQSELLIFGNPKIGSKIMQCNPEIGIDLPLKALAWKNDKGDVYLKYTNLKFIQTKYSLQDCAINEINKASMALNKLTMLSTK